MVSLRVIAAMTSEASLINIKKLLLENGCSVVDQTRNGQECLRKIRVLKPDLIILDYNLPTINGYEISKIAIDEKLCDVILLYSSEFSETFDIMQDESGFLCMRKPVNKSSLLTAIELMAKYKRKISGLEKDIEELKASIDTRKEVEIAKGLLMKNLNISEPEAFRKIQKQSMDKGITMKDIAKAIILAYDI